MLEKTIVVGISLKEILTILYNFLEKDKKALDIVLKTRYINGIVNREKANQNVKYGFQYFNTSH